ncbi:MAG: hypothetical protein mread185_000283 [Mycoplasmataceae bacterium]|nr:MAG: hypothetical protein mread185_000283 [Mycoplasmataceae bacterium]
MPIEEEKKSKEKQARNRKHKTLIKNQFKKVEIFLQGSKDNKDELKKLIAETQSILDKAKKKK